MNRLLDVYLPKNNISGNAKLLRSLSHCSMQEALKQARSDYKSLRKTGIKMAVDSLPHYTLGEQVQLSREIMHELVDLI